MIWAVVLAAGASSRYGVSPPKQVELLPAVLARLRAATALDGVLVVVGAHEVETDADTVFCPEWERGPGASLRCGLAALTAEAEAAIVVLADGPELPFGTEDALRVGLDRMRPDDDEDAVDGGRGPQTRQDRRQELYLLRRRDPVPGRGSGGKNDGPDHGRRLTLVSDTKT
jgi:hypothetical protein